jgi:hypothetical protein
LQTEAAVNAEILYAIEKGTYDSTKDYANAINSWFVDNLDAIIYYEDIAGGYGTNEETIFKYFSFDFTPTGYSDKYYIIMRNMNGLKFNGNYGEKTQGYYVYIEATGNKKIEFATTENVDFSDVPIFAAPPISKLVLTGGSESGTGCNNNGACESSRDENWKNCGDCGRLTIMIIAISSILILGLIIYFALHYWYKNKYEQSLFKSKNSLYNIVNYINNARAKGMADSDIKTNLKKAGWNSEQISYAMKKYKGKSTGMWPSR